MTNDLHTRGERSRSRFARQHAVSFLETPPKVSEVRKAPSVRNFTYAPMRLVWILKRAWQRVRRLVRISRRRDVSCSERISLA